MCRNSGDGNNVILLIITSLSEQGTTSQSFTLFLYPNLTFVSFWHIEHFSQTVANTPGSVGAAMVLQVCDMAVILLTVSQEGCDIAPVKPLTATDLP